MEMQERTFMPIWEHFVPASVDLYHVDYMDDLSEHLDLINKCVQKNNIYPLSEAVFDWWDCPEKYYMEEIQKNMNKAGFGYIFDDYFDEIQEWLWDHDTSTPIKDLLRNTRNQVYFYDLGIEVDGWHEAFLCRPWRGESEAAASAKIRRKLGIAKDSLMANRISSIVANASYGGHLRIYFECDLMDLLNLNGKDYRSITFKGKYNVAVYDPISGSGDYEPIELNCTFRFNRQNLFMSCKDADRYTLEDCFGTCSDWCSDCDAPSLSMASSRKGVCKTSSTAALSAKEAEYDRVFKAGGCTYGDTDIRRHRNVTYINEFPCRNECPHCGQEWID